jgi:hypothetical protein
MMPAIPNQPVPPGAVAAASKRVFARAAGDAPSPLFINAIELTSVGMDVFVDVGVVPPESLLAFQKNPPQEGDIPFVDMFVTARYGMSVQTAIMLHQRLTVMLQQLGEQQQTQMEHMMPKPEPSIGRKRAK